MGALMTRLEAKQEVEEVPDLTSDKPVGLENGPVINWCDAQHAMRTFPQ